MKLIVVVALAALTIPQFVAARVQTVCTITVNSADEKEMFRRYLPPERFQFVELVERGRPDWLASACRTGVRCDVLVISGHYDGNDEFFSDRLDEYLPVGELERASCNNSCPGVFSQLKEVYLFGCNTLNPEAQRSASAEVIRSLMRGGHSRGDAERLARSLTSRYGESSRERMRQIFKDVPVIYGFSSVAPLGPTAASTLSRYFHATGGSDMGSGRASAQMLGQFAVHSMAVTRGMTDADPNANDRRDLCQFTDDRLSDAQKLLFIHQLLQRPMAEVRMRLDRIELHTAALARDRAHTPEVVQGLEVIASDSAARARFLTFARDADQQAVRARMLKLAGMLGWLSEQQEREELLAMVRELLARNVLGEADVDLVCTLNKARDLDDDLDQSDTRARVDTAHAAIRACLGNEMERARTLEAMVGPSEPDVRIAQAYLRHRPITDPEELRRITTRITQMSGSDAQVRALQTLAHHRLSDPQSLEELTQLFPVADSWSVQTAIAGILIRADYRSIARPDVVRTLREYRRKSPYGEDVIDALIRRLQMP